ncbi:M28 family peptidase [Streptomyces sp. NPDC004227]
MTLDAVIGEIWTRDHITEIFHMICDTGGRLSGTDSEVAARTVLSTALDELSGQRSDFSFRYTGYQPMSARCEITRSGRQIGAVALPGCPGFETRELGLVVAGRGTEAEFGELGADVAGRMVIVQHEYPFTLNRIHRAQKYEWANAAGAAAFAISNNIRGIGPVTGGCGSRSDTDIPGIGLSYEDGELLRAAAATGSTVTLTVEAVQRTWDAHNLIVDIPGQENRVVVLCAHLDGHNLAESAMDNATGLAAVLEIGRLLARCSGDLRYGLRIALFTAEEWGLVGSKNYVASLDAAERERVVCAIALDSITGHPRLSALTGGDAQMASLVDEYSTRFGVPIDVVSPFMPNSDHGSFQEVGIPAMRIMAGFGDPSSLTRYLLTPADRREIVDLGQLKAATSVAAGLVYLACSGNAAQPD